MPEISVIMSHREVGVSNGKCDTHTYSSSSTTSEGSRLEALIDLSQVLTASELRINDFCQKKKKKESARFKTQCN